MKIAVLVVGIEPFVTFVGEIANILVVARVVIGQFGEIGT
jgi:hypothetical protein